MKKHLPSFLPALALLTLGGCAASSNLATTESDGMYYSASSDKVTAVAVPVAQQAYEGSPGDVPNPDYNGSNTRSGSNEYYDDDYYAATPRRNSVYRGGSLGYYSFPYADPYFYGAPIIAYSPYSPFGYSFYDPFYRPYYGYGGLTINIGFGYGFGRPYYRPYGYGYGYDPYYSYGSYYGGHYNNGYYNNGYYGNGYYGVGTDRPARNVTYGPRRSRTGNGAGLADVATGSGSNASPSRSRVVQEGRFATPDNGSSATPSAGQYNGRGRVRDVTVGNGSSAATGQPAAASSEAAPRTGRYRGETQPMPGAATASQPENSPRRWRVLDNSAPNTGGAPASDGRMVERSAADQPQSGRGRRATYYGGSNPGTQSSGTDAGTMQPRRQRMSESNSQPSRSYSEPSRSYSQPSQLSQPSRSYSEPSRSYSSPSPSSSPSSSPSGGNGGGGRGRVR